MATSHAQVYGHPLKSLMTFTCGGKPLPPAFIKSQYLIVLDRVESGTLNTRLRSVLNIVMKDRHVFRGGTSVDDDNDRREYYTNLIQTCRSERDDTTDTVGNSSSSDQTTNNRRTRKKKIDLVGRRVIMSADVFGGSVNEVYHGVIARKKRYRQHGKVKNGFVVKWHDGDEDIWCECIIIHMYYVHMTHLHIHNTQHNRSYNELLACLVDEEDENIFVDSEWLMIQKVNSSYSTQCRQLFT